jgi:hypothetical protein
MKETNVIYYLPGCYGTFLHWIFDYIDSNFELELPFESNGSSHKLYNNNEDLHFIPPQIVDYFNSDKQVPIFRCHPNVFSLYQGDSPMLFEKIYIDDLTYLKDRANKIIVLYADKSSLMFFLQNFLTKISVDDSIFTKKFSPLGYELEKIPWLKQKTLIDKLKFFIYQSCDSTENFKFWSYDTKDTLSLWELREIVSYRFFNKYLESNHELTSWNNVQKAFNNIKFVEISQLCHNFQKTILDCVSYFNYDTEQLQPKLEHIEQEWRIKQTHINKDLICKQIVDNIVSKKFFDWSKLNLNLLDEAYIQKLLREQNIEIKCWNLDVFPGNTDTLMPYLEYK